jgi:CRP-like cAMP-binding protein
VDTSHGSANALLASLSHADASRLAPSLQIVSCQAGLVLGNPGDEVENIFFPHTGMISLLAVMRDGTAIETATVGREGAAGVMAGLGLHVTLARVVVQTPLVASRIAAPQFRRAVEASTALRDMIVRYNEVLLAQVQMTAACNALHTLEQRLARWILQTRDRLDHEAIPLTQELLSEMLGVRRSSVSEIASKLQAANLVTYSRGTIAIVDRAALERTACECYDAIKLKTARVLR